MRLARIMRARQRSGFLLTGTLLTVIGVMLPSVAASFCGMLVRGLATAALAVVIGSLIYGWLDGH